MEKLATWYEAFDFKGIVYRIVREIDSNNIDEAIAMAFDNVYRTIKGLDPYIKIHPYPANVGLADSMIKVCNFG